MENNGSKGQEQKEQKMVEERVCWANSLICSNHGLERWKHRGRSSNMAISWEVPVTTWRFQCENHWTKSPCSVAMYDYQRGNYKTSIVPPLLQLILFPGLSRPPWSTGPYRHDFTKVLVHQGVTLLFKGAKANANFQEEIRAEPGPSRGHLRPGQTVNSVYVDMVIVR